MNRLTGLLVACALLQGCASTKKSEGDADGDSAVDIVTEGMDVPIEPDLPIDPAVDPTVDPTTDPVEEDPITDPVTEDPITDPVVEDPITDPVVEDPVTDPVPDPRPDLRPDYTFDYYGDYSWDYYWDYSWDYSWDFSWDYSYDWGWSDAYYTDGYPFLPPANVKSTKQAKIMQMASKFKKCKRTHSVADAKAFSLAKGQYAITSMKLCGLMITYVHKHGYFVQEKPGGPAIEVFTGAKPKVKVGGRINLLVTTLENHKGAIEIAGSAVKRFLPGHKNNVKRFVQDLSSGIAPDATLEDEVVRVTDATVTSVVNSKTVLIDYGSAQQVTLKVKDSSLLEPGTKLSLQGIVARSKGTWLIKTWAKKDLSIPAS